LTQGFQKGRPINFHFFLKNDYCFSFHLIYFFGFYFWLLFSLLLKLYGMGPFCRLMDTISLMQQLLPHLASQQQQLQGTAATFGSTSATTSSTPLQNTQFSSPSSSSSNSNGILPFGFMKISPTTTVIDANCGLPTAAEASPPSHHQSLMSLISKTEAALPPEAASTSYSGGACMQPPPPHNLVQSYMAAVHAAAALQSDAFHSAFRTPFPSSSSSQPSPSSSSMPPPPSTAASMPSTAATPTPNPTSSDSFFTLALNTLVPSSDSTNDSKDDSSKFLKFFKKIFNSFYP
jgi:hypothetical protein